MATYWENSCSFGLRYVSWYKYLTVNLVFSRLGFWSGNLFLIAPFPDFCLLVPFCVSFGHFKGAERHFTASFAKISLLTVGRPCLLLTVGRPCSLLTVGRPCSLTGDKSCINNYVIRSWLDLSQMQY